MSIFSSKPASSAILDVKKFSDTIYKGETRTGYSAKGGGLGGEVAIDLGKIFLFFQAGLEFKGQVTRASQTMVVVHRGPSVTPGSGGTASLDAHSSLIVNNIVGVVWKGQMEAAFSLSVGLSMGFGSGGIVDDKGNDAKFSSGSNKFNDEGVGNAFSSKGSVDTQTRSVEVFSSSIGVKAGLSLSGLAGWSHYWGKCVGPLYYDNYKHVAVPLKDILLGPKQVKKKSKEDAVAFLNDHAKSVGAKGKVSYSRKMGMGHVSSSELISKLRGYNDSLRANFKSRFGDNEARWPKLHQSVLSECNNLIQLLQPAAPPSAAALDSQAFMRVSSNNQSTTFNIGASASAGASVVGLASASASVGLDLVDASWERKASTIRFQSHSLNRQTLWTHDTVLTYNTLGVKALQVKGSVSGNMIGLGSRSVKGAKAAKSWSPAAYNWIAYKSTIVYWERPAEDSYKTAPRKFKKDHKTAKAKVLPGTGICIGRSFSLENLRAVYKVDRAALDGFKSKVKMKKSQLATSLSSGKAAKILGPQSRPVQGKITQTEERAFNTDPESPEFKLIQTGLGVEAGPLRAFFDDEVVRQMIFTMFKRDAFVKAGNKGPTVGSAFLEVAFKAPSDVKQVDIRNTGNIEMDYESSGKLLKTFEAWSTEKKMNQLVAIRLRVRQQDLDNDNRALFSLGFKIAGTGLKIKILKVEEAGLGGFVELRSVFFSEGEAAQLTRGEDQNKRVFDGNEYLQRQETSVPPAALYCQ